MRIPRKMEDYKFIFAAQDTHAPITSWDMLKVIGEWDNSGGLMYLGFAVGKAELRFENKRKKYVHSESVRLSEECRKKGHGIILYRCLIEKARELGATRIYSSKSLNEHSNRMWAEKLPNFYQVKTIRGCRKACRHCTKKARYYIDL